MGLLGYLVTGDWKEIDPRKPVGWATKETSAASSERPEKAQCSHDWEESGRKGLGWTGGDYHGGRGEAVSLIHYTCLRCGESKTEEETS